MVTEILQAYNLNIVSDDEFDDDESPAFDEASFDEKETEESNEEYTGVAANVHRG